MEGCSHGDGAGYAEPRWFPTAKAQHFIVHAECLETALLDLKVQALGQNAHASYWHARRLAEPRATLKTDALNVGVPERKRRKAVTASEMLRCDPWR